MRVKITLEITLTYINVRRSNILIFKWITNIKRHFTTKGVFPFWSVRCNGQTLRLLIAHSPHWRQTAVFHSHYSLGGHRDCFKTDKITNCATGSKTIWCFTLLWTTTHYSNQLTENYWTVAVWLTANPDKNTHFIL